ncbi:MAG: Chitinase 3 [Icmadophila ericetorum]|nr:Chitinase 3 [Icmadophila ericetorum]
MQLNLRSIALVAVVFASQITLSVAGPVQAHKHHQRLHRRNPDPELSRRQAPAAYPQIQAEVDKFSAWMANWFASPNAGSASSIAQVQQELQNHEAAMAAAMGNTTSSQATQVLQSEIESFGAWISTWVSSASVMSPTDAVASLRQDVTSYEDFLSSWLGSPVVAAPSAPASPTTTVMTTITLSQTTTLVSVVTASGTPPPARTTAAPATTPAAAPSVSTAVILSITPVSTTPATTQSASAGGSQNGGTGSAFNPNADDNIALYFGQTAALAQVDLAQVCSAPGTTIVIVAFVTQFFGPGGYPIINFSGAIPGTVLPAAQAIGATGLLDASKLAAQVTQCQQMGKAVLLSLGGADDTSLFTSDQQAQTFATQIWNLFGGGTGEKSDLRPFGNVKFDGFDIDSETANQAGWTAFTTQMRSLYAQDKSKTYYISGAPQCPRPDQSIPLAAMQQMDFVWVQFYNNGDCNVGASDFVSSFEAWSSDLSTGKGANGNPTKLFVGVPATEDAAPDAYLAPAALTTALQSIKGKASNMGGVMMWDGSEAVLNNNYQEVAKQALG